MTQHLSQQEYLVTNIEAMHHAFMLTSLYNATYTLISSYLLSTVLLASILSPQQLSQIQLHYLGVD